MTPYIVEFSTLPDKCAYLKDRRSRMEYKFIENCPSALNDSLVRQGWRRFGEYFSRPQCKGCEECLSLRIDAPNFHFSKSKRRVLKKNENCTSVIVRKPSISKDHLDLYKKYHLYMQKKRDWKYYDISAEHYYKLFVAGSENFGLEFLYFCDGKLVGVDLVDELDDGLSSIYFYYDPDYARLNLGKYSIYQQIFYAISKQKRWIYLGYYVKDCQSLAYKNTYSPLEVLLNNPCEDSDAVWESWSEE